MYLSLERGNPPCAANIAFDAFGYASGISVMVRPPVHDSGGCVTALGVTSRLSNVRFDLTRVFPLEASKFIVRFHCSSLIKKKALTLSVRSVT